MNFSLNGTGFDLDQVLLKETKEEWLEWAVPRHFDGFSEVQKTRFLTEVWESAQKYKKDKETPKAEEPAAPRKKATPVNK